MSEGRGHRRLLRRRRRSVDVRPRLVKIAKCMMRRAASRRVKMETRPQVKAIRIRGDAKCAICLGMIKRDLPSVICACGERFHNTCAARTGTCPDCGKQLWCARQKPHVVDSSVPTVKPMRLSKEDKLFLLEERFLLGDITERTYFELRDQVRDAPETAFFCNACGRRLLDGDSCDCTTALAESQCPECGSTLSGKDMFCRTCGVVFAEDFPEDLFQCPECSRIVSESEGQCECGALLVGEGSMICPGCGAEIPESTSECPICGHLFIEEICECPACGRRVDRDACLCECGVVFSDGAVGAECSECGTSVGLEDVFCPRCGARFSDSQGTEEKLERVVRS
ncbi:MAG: hypothetical protein JSV90_07660 [Methanobacteriota archaeon]|nr:MAG: hypothetical protein JSV90_07660 [Euryarchaeota archaeon]